MLVKLGPFKRQHCHQSEEDVRSLPSTHNYDWIGNCCCVVVAVAVDLIVNDWKKFPRSAN